MYFVIIPNTDLSTRALIVTLKSPFCGKSTGQISAITGISPRTIDAIYGRACQRGFKPNGPTIKLFPKYLEDAPRIGPPKQEAIREAAIQKVRRDRYGREKSCADKAGDLSLQDHDVSSTTVWRVLKAAGYNKTKPARKLGLTKNMRQERLNWCLVHKDWTLEDWKNFIWSDKISVVLNHHYGSHQVWKKSGEACARSVIREKWKGYTKFMFWGCFSMIIKVLLEMVMREEWELLIGIKRIGLRNRPSKAPR